MSLEPLDPGGNWTPFTAADHMKTGNPRDTTWDETQIDEIYDLFTRPEWHQHAACRGQDPNLFFPERGGSLVEARACCHVCPVTAECAEAGLYEDYGLWGGMSARKRRPLRQQTARCGSDAGYSRHRYNGTEPCAECRRAHALYNTLRAAKKKTSA